ncbi:hypothetical protein CDD82_572 [Ophiocordyceps australis]|uniref:F-box domain-containing protein n=1 Tax=Ophiocordyceps australis TaxID=1399860 RepID=A0A2C5YM86_9HYPO|nr:hypothetical protein CDD82_572 [Ophiocordyceps australis]
MGEQTPSNGSRVGKRKKPWSSDDADSDDAKSDDAKRAKTETGSGTVELTAMGAAGKLPASTWQRVLVLVPPKTLGALLSVNRVFNQWLDPKSKFQTPQSQTRLRPDAIWQASRRRFWPRMPAPLRGCSEVDMWRLCCSRHCSLCNLAADSKQLGNKQWHLGPGTSGVAPIFSGRVVACAQCLVARTDKEALLYLTPGFPTFLLSGIPMLWMTPQVEVVPTHILHKEPALVHGKVTKFFFRQHVLDIKADFESVKTTSPAVADEWIKGLESQGQRRVADVSRWERWHRSGGVLEMRNSWPEKHKTVVGEARQPPAHAEAKPRDGQGVEAMIACIANRYIARRLKTEKVTKKTVYSFAARLLRHVRNTFYLEAARRAKEGNKPRVKTDRLTLQHMQWLFNVGIKPDGLKMRSLGLMCKRCVGRKRYSMSALMQHYIARHKPTKKRHSLKLYEWPAEPMFRLGLEPEQDVSDCAEALESQQQQKKKKKKKKKKKDNKANKDNKAKSSDTSTKSLACNVPRAGAKQSPLEPDEDEYEPRRDTWAHHEPDLKPASSVYVGRRSFARGGSAAKAVSNAAATTTAVWPSPWSLEASPAASHRGRDDAAAPRAPVYPPAPTNQPMQQHQQATAIHQEYPWPPLPLHQPLWLGAAASYHYASLRAQLPSCHLPHAQPHSLAAALGRETDEYDPRRPF